MKYRLFRFSSLGLILAILVSACGGAAPTSTQAPTQAAANTSAPVEPAATATPEKVTTQIIIDGDASDWAKYSINVSDDAGDQAAGGVDLGSATYFANDQYLYGLITFHEAGNWDDMPLGLVLTDGVFSQLNLRPNGYVTTGGENSRDVQIEMVVTDTVIEFKVALDEFPEGLEDFYAVTVYFHANGDDEIDIMKSDARVSLAYLDEFEPDQATRTSFTTSGEMYNDETWSGEITLTGDVYIQEGTTLKILPGTIIYLTPDSDDQNCCGNIVGSWNSDNAISLETRGGKLIAVGEQDSPIIFVPVGIDLTSGDLVGDRGNNPNSGKWQGLQVGPNSSICFADLYYAAFGIIIKAPTYESSLPTSTICNVNIVSPLFDGIQAENVDLYVHHSHIENVSGFAIRAGVAGSLTLQNNVIVAARTGVLTGEQVSVSIQNNIFLDDHQATELDSGAGTTMDVINNTIVLQESPPEYWYYGDEQVAQSVGAECGLRINGLGLLYAANNIIFGLFDCSFLLNFDFADGSVITNNLVQGPHDAATPVPNMPDSKLNGDPQFLDPASGDFHLDASSPAIDAGAPGTTDADGSPADLGAYGGEHGDDW